MNLAEEALNRAFSARAKQTVSAIMHHHCSCCGWPTSVKHLYRCPNCHIWVRCRDCGLEMCFNHRDIKKEPHTCPQSQARLAEAKAKAAAAEAEKTSQPTAPA